MRQRNILTAVFICAALTAQPAAAQVTSGITDSVFTNPGARSIGLGGAFAAIADDATAAFANPAGLVQILRPEVSAELRGTAVSGDEGLPFESSAGLSGLGFFSFVFPSHRWAVALYTHQIASLDFAFDSLSPLTREFSVRSYSGAFAYQISDDLSAGAGLNYFSGNRDSGSSLSEISDHDWGVNLGVLWNVAPEWRIAGFYRQGPGFESESQSIPSAPGSRFAPRKLNASNSNRLTLPDEYGVGFAYQPGAGGWTIGFELDRIGSATDPFPGGYSSTEPGSEFHLGVEYAVLSWKPVAAFRMGIWREHGGDRVIIADAEVVRSTFTDANDHFAFGFGLAYKAFQFDLGADLSDRAAVGSVSIVISF